MATQHFIPREYSLRPQDVIPPDEDDARDQDWREYRRAASQVDTDDLMLLVSEACSTSEVLRNLIEDIKRTPFLPGERRGLHISDCLALGTEVAALVDQALDDLVGLAQMGRAR